MITFKKILEEEGLKNFEDYKKELPDVWARFNIVRNKKELDNVYRKYEKNGYDKQALENFYNEITNRFSGTDMAKQIVTTQIYAGSPSNSKR